MFESHQFGGGIGGRGEPSGSRSGRSPQCVVEGEAGCARTAIEGTVGTPTFSSNGHGSTPRSWIKNEELLSSVLYRHALLRKQITAARLLYIRPHPIRETNCQGAQLETSHSKSHPFRGSAEAVRTRSAKRRWRSVPVVVLKRIVHLFPCQKNGQTASRFVQGSSTGWGG